MFLLRPIDTKIWSVGEGFTLFPHFDWRLIVRLIFSTRALIFINLNRSCGTVMFSQATAGSQGGGGGSHVRITHDALDSLYRLPRTPDIGSIYIPQRHQKWDLLSFPCYWHLVVITGICSNLLTWGPTPTPHLNWHLVVATETCTVGKQVVRILLECFLVVNMQCGVRFCNDI